MGERVWWNDREQIMTAATENSEMGHAGNEQLIFNDIVANDINIDIQWLYPKLFISGLYYGQDNLFTKMKNWSLRQVMEYNQIVISDNCISGNTQKETYAKQWKHCFIDENKDCIINLS